MRIWMKELRREAGICLVATLVMVSLVPACERLYLSVATAGLLYIVVIVLVSRVGSIVSSIIAAVVATLCLIYIAPPSNSFRVDDPFDLVAIACFLLTSLLVAQLVFRLRNLAQDALSSVDRRLVDAEERERAWVARELHDDFNQRLALIAVDLDCLQSDLSDSHSVAAQRLCGIQEQISTLTNDIQALSHHLHSSTLQILGIATAAKRLCQDLGQKHRIAIRLQTDRVPKNLPQEIAVSIYRVLQEALQNGVKHSKSAHFEVSLLGKRGGIELVVHDAGVGFDPQGAMKGRGLGLISMQERIKLVNGQFAVVSATNRGTTVYAKVPLGTGKSLADNSDFGLENRNPQARRANGAGRRL